MAEEPSKVVVTNLSKNLLGLKFMKRRMQTDEQKSLEEEKQRELDTEHWILDHDTSSVQTNRVETDVSIVICENLSHCGRRSFRNFNPPIERLYEEMKAEHNRGIETEHEVDVGCTAVTDEEMAERYGTLVHTIGKKFGRKRRSHPLDEQETGVPQSENRTKLSKRKFLKPDS